MEREALHVNVTFLLYKISTTLHHASINNMHNIVHQALIEQQLLKVDIEKVCKSNVRNAHCMEYMVGLHHVGNCHKIFKGLTLKI